MSQDASPITPNLLGEEFAGRRVLITGSSRGIGAAAALAFATLGAKVALHGTKKSFGFATAGWTAAPATGRIIQRIGPLLGVTPVDEASPAVGRALTVESLQGKRIETY